jgi:hypothetical protein
LACEDKVPHAVDIPGREFGFQFVRNEVVNIGEIWRTRKNGNTTTTIETLSLLVATQSATAGCDTPPALRTLNVQFLLIAIVRDFKSRRGEVKVPSSFDQSPACFNLGRET